MRKKHAKILFIGARESSVMSLNYLFESNGLQVLSPHTTEKALSLLRSEKPEVVLLDFSSDKDLHLLHQINLERKTKDFSVILTVPEHQDFTPEQIAEIGVSRIVEHPFHFSMLLAAIHSELYKQYTGIKYNTPHRFKKAINKPDSVLQA